MIVALMIFFLMAVIMTVAWASAATRLNGVQKDRDNWKRLWAEADRRADAHFATAYSLLEDKEARDNCPTCFVRSRKNNQTPSV